MYFNSDFIAKKYLIESYKWYDEKSVLYKKSYVILTVSSIVISAIIPFISLFIETFPLAKYLIAFLSTVIVIMTALKANFRLHEKWIEYRSAAENLKYQMYLFDTESSPYKGEGKGELLLRNVRMITEKENMNWRSLELDNKEASSKPA